MPRVIPIEVEQDILSKYYTHTAKEIALEYNNQYKVSSIKGVWQRHGLTGKNKKFPEDPKEIEEIYYKFDKSIQKVADYYNSTYGSTKIKLESLGLKKELLLTDIQKTEIAEQYLTKTSAQLSQEYGVSASRISQIWKEFGKIGKVKRRYSLDETCFENVSSEEQAYWLGFLAADGCVYLPRNNRQAFVQITLQRNDEEHLQKFQSFLKSTRPILRHEKSEDKKYSTLSISSDKIAHDIGLYGVCPRKTYTDNWPEHLPEELLPAYIRGYFDGDGSISHNFTMNKMHLVSVTIVGFLPNIQHFKDYFDKVGIKNNITIDKRKKSDIPFCLLFFPNKKAKNSFLHLIYDNANVYLERKYILSQQFFDFFSKNTRTWTVKSNAVFNEEKH